MKINTDYVEIMLAESKKDITIDEFIMKLEAESEEDENEILEEIEFLENHGNTLITYVIERLETRLAFMKAGVARQEVDILDKESKQAEIKDILENKSFSEKEKLAEISTYLKIGKDDLK